MATVGGDVSAMFAFVNELRRRRSKIDAATRKLGVLVEQANWVGPDREAFVSEWHGTHVPNLVGVVDQIDDAARRVVHHAQQQEQASS